MEDNQVRLRVGGWIVAGNITAPWPSLQSYEINRLTPPLPSALVTTNFGVGRLANPAGQGDVQHQVLGVLVFKQELLTACGLVLLRLNTIRATIFTEALFSRKC